MDPDLNIDIPRGIDDTDDDIHVLMPEESPMLVRFVFAVLFGLALAAVIFLWKRATTMEQEGRDMSLRGELLSNHLIFLSMYCAAWLPVLALGTYDGELETSSVSVGIRGQLANAHCGLMDLLVRSFCMSIVISASIYVCYKDAKESEELCTGRPSMFTWSMFLPVLLSEGVRLLLDQEKWLMPTNSVISRLDEFKFSVKLSPIFCVQLMDTAWLRQLLAEWFLTVVTVVFGIYCCSPCFQHQQEEPDEGRNSDAGASGGSEACDLQMDSLLGDDSPPSGATTQRVGSSAPDASEDVESSKPKGLFARGVGFLEAFVIIGILWSAIIRPFMAISLYITQTETYSNYLDIPTHAFLIISVFCLPVERSSCVSGAEEDQEAVEKKPEVSAPAIDETDEDPIWIVDEEKGTVCIVTRDEPDVEPIWIYGKDEGSRAHTTDNGELKANPGVCSSK